MELFALSISLCATELQAPLPQHSSFCGNAFGVLLQRSQKA